jgi:uncharacterized protein (TIGR02246 family)
MKLYVAPQMAAGMMMVLIGCSAQDTHDADVKAIKDNEVQWNKNCVAKDQAKLLAHYADDAVLMSPGAPTANGKSAIEGVFKEMLSDPALSLKFESARIEVSKGGDVGYTQGSYTMTMTNPATKQTIEDKGSYVTTYRKTADGSWKAVADIASSGTMPGVPPASASK